MIRKQGMCRAIIIYRQGWTIQATPPRIICPTANIEDDVALVITRYFGPTSSAAEILYLFYYCYELLRIPQVKLTKRQEES